jgi:hypothetical protein
MLLKDDSASLETLHNFYRDKEKLAADIKFSNEPDFQDKLLQLTIRKRIDHITKINIQKNRAEFSKTKIEKELLLEQHVSEGIFDPDSWPFLVWDLAYVGCTYLQVIGASFIASFYDLQEFPTFLAQLPFVFDFILQFNTGTYIRGRKCMRWVSCIRVYIKNEFWWDVLVLIPMFYYIGSVIFFIPLDYGLYQVLIFLVLIRRVRVNGRVNKILHRFYPRALGINIIRLFH